MRTSKHAQIRMAQRGIDEQDVEEILQTGTRCAAPGGAERCIVTRREIHGLQQYYRSEIRRLDRLKGKAVIASADGMVITVEHMLPGRRIKRS